ncbi:Uncharacterised protein [uncultured archaeon]|nr:Uncharacterised protein [uncultured archaeon]
MSNNISLDGLILHLNKIQKNVVNKPGNYNYEYLWLDFAGDIAILHKSSGYDYWEDCSNVDAMEDWEIRMPQDKMRNYLSELIDKKTVKMEKVLFKENYSKKEPNEERIYNNKEEVTDLSLTLEQDGDKISVKVFSPIETISGKAFF